MYTDYFTATDDFTVKSEWYSLFSELQLLVKFKANNYHHSLPTTTGCYNKRNKLNSQSEK